jgi:hypothetical protein
MVSKLPILASIKCSEFRIMMLVFKKDGDGVRDRVTACIPLLDPSNA